jgi:hypothetical protein
MRLPKGKSRARDVGAHLRGAVVEQYRLRTGMASPVEKMRRCVPLLRFRTSC